MSKEGRLLSGTHLAAWPLVLFFLAAAAVGAPLFIFWHFNLFILSSYLLVVAQAGLGLFVWLKNPRSLSNIFFSLFTYSIAAWNFLAMVIFQYAPDELFWGDWVIFIFATLMIFWLLMFTLVFPSRSRHLNRWTAAALPAAPALLIAALLVEHRFIISSIVFIERVRTPLFGQGYQLFALYALVFCALTVANLAGNYRRADREGKIRLRFFLIGAVFSIAGIITSNLLLPWMGVAALEWMGAWFSLVMIGFTAYAITKHRLLDISIVISRAVAELLAIILLGAGYLLLVLVYQSVISLTIDPAFVVLTVLYGILVGQLHQRLRLFFQTTADKLFLRGKYDYFQELSQVTTRVGEKLSLSSVLEVLYHTFRDVVEISNPRILLPENFRSTEGPPGDYRVYDPLTAAPQPEGESVRADDMLVRELIARRRPLLNPKNPSRELIVPCLLEERLIAIFVLGRKLSEDAYLNEDIRMLEVLASQAAIALDHTRSYEEIKNELELVERQLTRSERLASLGTLTAGVTHEIRNPLTVIRGETERLANKERTPAELKEYRDLVLKHVDRIASIVQRMLSMAKEKPRQLIDVDLNECVSAALQLVTISRIKLDQDLELVPLIKGDPVEIEEVCVNLIQNAVNAMPDGGLLTVRTYIDEGRAVLEIADTGKGIPEELREKIFDPFFSTRHEGVGLGLSIAYRIIREHGGDIRVESEVGKGTTFKVLF